MIKRITLENPLPQSNNYSVIEFDQLENGDVYVWTSNGRQHKIGYPVEIDEIRAIINQRNIKPAILVKE